MRLDLIHALHTQEQSGGLTRPVGNERAVQIAVFALEKASLKASERTANAQVKLLARIHRQRLVQIGFAKVRHRLLDVRVGDGTEVAAQNAALVIGPCQHVAHCVDHFEADVLALLVTVQPEHQEVSAAALLLQKGRHAELGVGLLFHCLRLEQLRRIYLRV